MTGNFDQSLIKYRHVAQEITSISVVDLLAKFTTYKKKALDDRSLDKFKALNQPVAAFFGKRAAVSVDDDAADKFRLKLATRLAPATQRERLTTLNACWNWAVKQKLLIENPWTEVLKRVKVPPKQKPQPFTKAEAIVILSGFRQSKHYRHYADFVEFLLSSGYRLGEIANLFLPE